MLKSMTAYGRASKMSPQGHFVAEVHSLNKKYFEVSVQMPKELSFLETEVRKWISSTVARGKVTVKISAGYEDQIPISISPNLPLVRELKKAWEKIANELNCDSSALSLELLANEPAVLTYNEHPADEDVYKNILKQVVDAATAAFIEMKLNEGLALKEDFLQRLSALEAHLATILQFSQKSVSQYREKLIKVIEQILPGSVGNDERILREICLFADKVDIAEEITRLKSHLKQFSEIVDSEKNEKGKTLEFLTQEMNREINTIGSKSAEIEITKLVIEMKSEIEKIREQVQNVE